MRILWEKHRVGDNQTSYWKEGLVNNYCTKCTQ